MSNIKLILIQRFAPLVRPRGKESFLKLLRRDDKLLDVGCGNNSPIRAKVCAPFIHYTGLDIGDYNQGARSLEAADDYIVTTPSKFASTIESSVDVFDAVVSSHNLEHCEEPERVLRAMCSALKRDGRLYLSFPSEASVNLPSRSKNTLNYYDDKTHTSAPPRLSQVIALMKSSGMQIDFLAARYRPLIPMIFGLLLEPLSIWRKRAMPLGSSWALYGFETVIWATKRSTGH